MTDTEDDEFGFYDRDHLHVEKKMVEIKTLFCTKCGAILGGWNVAYLHRGKCPHGFEIPF